MAENQCFTKDDVTGDYLYIIYGIFGCVAGTIWWYKMASVISE